MFKLKIAIIFVAVCFNPLVQASQIVIHVKDSSGQPLSQAVIEVIPQVDVTVPLPIHIEPAIMDQVNKRFLPDLLLIHQTICSVPE